MPNTKFDDAVVVVGSGPVGVRVVQELHRRAPGRPIVLCGAEPHEPYNRVRLSSLLLGEVALDELQFDQRLPDTELIERRFGCPIVSIDRERRTVRDALGRTQAYRELVLALGSSPHVPDIDGITLPGVFTFRDLLDAQKLCARRARSRRTLVLGGGLLGLEAARAMRRFHTEVVVADHNDRLMARQLDAGCAQPLRAHVERMGIEVLLGDGIRRVRGRGRVEAVEFVSGRVLACDTVIVAAGIRPHVNLARRAGLPVNRGIRIDDETRTADPAIFAVGECAEHRGLLYGLLAPGLEQASVAAANIAGRRSTYLGSIQAARLKVVGLPVFSVGRVAEEDMNMDCRRISFDDREKGARVTLIIERGRAVGAAAVGADAGIGRLQELVRERRRVWAWQRLRFSRTGWLAADEAGTVATWPASATVCNCTGVTRGQLGAALQHTPCADVAALGACTGAGTVCGSCRPLLRQLLGGAAPLQAVRGAPALWTAGALAGSLALGLLLPWNLPDPASAHAGTLHLLWRDESWKQASGYTLLGLSALTLLLSLRKRVKRISLGDFAGWRVAHVVIGVLAVLTLAIHTGGRMGSNLNFALAASFGGAVVLGAVSGALTAREHRGGARAVARRRQGVWLHIVVLWPLPALLGLHIVSAYYF
jgi:nitrite reductase (NADH) large subunit